MPERKFKFFSSEQTMTSELRSLDIGNRFHSFDAIAATMPHNVTLSNSSVEQQYEAIIGYANHFHHYLYVNLVASTMLGVLLVYLIAHKSPRGMVFYQWLLVNSTLSGYTIAAAVVVLRPVPLSPPFVGFCLGPLRFTSTSTSNVPFKIICVMAYNLSTCYFIGFCYQYASVTQALAQRRVSSVDQRTQKYVLFTISYAFFCIALVLGMHYGIDGVNATPEQLRRTAAASGGLAMLLLQREPTLTSFSARNRWTVAFAAMSGVWIVLLFGLSVLLNWKFLRLLNGSRHAVPLTTVTRNLQVMLCRTFMFKTMILFVSIYVPMLITYTSMAFHKDDPRIRFVGIFSISMYAPLSYLHTIIFFLPYRRHLWEVIRGRCGRKTMTGSSHPFMVVATTGKSGSASSPTPAHLGSVNAIRQDALAIINRSARASANHRFSKQCTNHCDGAPI